MESQFDGATWYEEGEDTTSLRINHFTFFLI